MTLSHFPMPSLIDTLTEALGDARHLPAHGVEELSRLFIQRRYPRSTILVLAGDLWDRVYYIRKGMIRLYYTDSQGREFNKGFFREGQLLWPVAPYARKKGSLFSISALEDLQVSVCGFDAFYRWLSTHRCWEHFALPYAESLAGEKFLREHDFLMKSATDRFLDFRADHPDLTERIPDYHLASYLGMTNVSLSRIKKKITS